MAQVLVLSEAEVTALLDLEQLLAALANALVSHSAGRASVPPRVAASATDGILGAMPVHLTGVALGAKLVSVFPGNHRLGRPSHQALIALFDPADGTPLALMDGTRITAARTGAAAAVAAGALARPDATVLAILGAGVQGRSHLDAFPLVRDFREIRVASRTPGRADALAEGHPLARAAGSFEEAVAGADVVCCCTDAREPVLEAGWLAPGAHVSSVGGTFGPELDPATVRSGRVFVEWRRRHQPAPGRRPRPPGPRPRHRHRDRRGPGRHQPRPHRPRPADRLQVDRPRGRGRGRRRPGLPPRRRSGGRHQSPDLTSAQGITSAAWEGRGR
jgi:ornithine cyclodeaminase/alanine dehydrogenase-like protein (mu-crystallin family)